MPSRLGFHFSRPFFNFDFLPFFHICEGTGTTLFIIPNPPREPGTPLEKSFLQFQFEKAFFYQGSGTWQKISHFWDGNPNYKKAFISRENLRFPFICNPPKPSLLVSKLKPQDWSGTEGWQYESILFGHVSQIRHTHNYECKCVYFNSKLLDRKALEMQTSWGEIASFGIYWKKQISP